VFILETEGDAIKVAQEVIQKCSDNIGRVTVVDAEVQSEFEPIKDAAVRIASEHVGRDEKFCFRLHKRGSHSLVEDTFDIEREIGRAMWQTLQQKYGTEPAVDLDEPDITVSAEVLGRDTAMGFSRKDWTAQPVQIGVENKTIERSAPARGIASNVSTECKIPQSCVNRRSH
jgi:tRNA(Ser,Leu) C12 N-acetylase TAN1